jgi:hypothetical protein
MAASTCQTCRHKAFEIKLVEPRKAQFKHYFVQCASCGAPAGVIDFRNSPKLIDELAKEMRDSFRYLGGELTKISRQLDQLEDRSRSRPLQPNADRAPHELDH